jgi:hypothetical protein
MSCLGFRVEGLGWRVEGLRILPGGLNDDLVPRRQDRAHRKVYTLLEPRKMRGKSVTNQSQKSEIFTHPKLGKIEGKSVKTEECEWERRVYMVRV